MRISTSRDKLLKPLLMVSNIVERNQTLPILSNILMETRNQRLFITTTDLEMQFSTSIPVEATDKMSFTLPARKLVDICKTLPNEANIELAFHDDKVTLLVGRGKYTMSILPATDYPNIDIDEISQTFHIPQVGLKRLIDKTAFSMAQQDVRYYLNGLLIEILSGKIRTVATDGHRLALCDSNLQIESDMDGQIILPRKAVVELGRLLGDGDKVAKVELSNNYIRVTVDDTRFVSKLIDGRFPEYERVIPSGETYQMVVDKQTLKQTLVRISVLSNLKYRGVRFNLENHLLHLQAHNTDRDEAKEEIEVEYTGQKIDIGFNVAYLLEVLNVIETDQVNISLVDADSSCLIRPTDSDECRYIVMPMRL